MVNKVGTKFPETLFGTDEGDNLSGLGGNDTLLGLGGTDDLSGDGGRDSLIGGAGNDHLDGGARADVLRGGGDNDVLNGGAGNDKLFGGTGIDWVSYIDSKAGVKVDLAAGTATGDGNDVLTSLENIIGSKHNDRLLGDGGANAIKGNTGADVIFGGGKKDTLHGGANADKLHGGAGKDHIFGDGGHDVITGDHGNDVLVGGRGSDTFNYSFGDGNDKINNFKDGGKGTNEILHFTDISAEQLTFERQGGDVLIHIHTLTTAFPIVNTITVQKWYSAVGAKLDHVEATDHTFTAAEIESMLPSSAAAPDAGDHIF